MKLKQISVQIENAPGRLYEITRTFGEAGVNLRALNLADKGEFGILRLLVSDIAKARRIMMEKHLPGYVESVVAIEVEDKPGSLAKILKCVMEAKINVIYMYAFTGLVKKAVMIFHFSDNDGAIEVLEKNGVNIFNAEAFGILDASDS